jgi:hypothetical protein
LRDVGRPWGHHLIRFLNGRTTGNMRIRLWHSKGSLWTYNKQVHVGVSARRLLKMRSCRTLAGVVVTVSASMGAVRLCHEACKSPIVMYVLKKESPGLALNERKMKA